ncbi:M-phase phosphoprotein 9 isoform X2 [Phascolarctos cinereus]|uniref:M-phase phosphoprotein 9 isoform X2 n=1 Tax=Phascolarctos cinereus TaxID=38626 RepID=A0A6P5J3M2_PHACI|nr:M-phase phosphoprotein 9 isoform X2 [Phascolarctos cinereus]
MEDLDLVKTKQETFPSSIESDVRNTHSSVGYSLNTNRSRNHPLSANGLSSFSGKTSISLIQSAVEVLTSFMQDLQNSGKADSEIWRKCEAKWLQLFSLVEAQRQQQIFAQQEQFSNQIKHIEEEIRNLIKLRKNNASWSSCNRLSPDKLTNSFSTSENQMGLCSESCERNEYVVNYPKLKETEIRPKTFSSHQDSIMDSISMNNGGYSNFFISERNPYKSKDSKEFKEHKDISKGKHVTPMPQKDSFVSDVKNKSLCIQPTEEYASALKEDVSVFPGEYEHNFTSENKISEAHCGKSNSKFLTSWAQKLKQNHPKRVHIEEGYIPSVQGNEQRKKSAIENSNFSAATYPHVFYVNKPDESPSSWASEGTGMNCWKLEEKDMYDSLPETLEKSFLNINPMKVLPNQPNSANEMKLPSLKDIYHTNQRRNKQSPEWTLASTNPSRPPEVLTLDPTLHRKPNQQISGIQSNNFRCNLERLSFSPESILDPSISSHSETDSFSQTSNLTSSQLDRSPNYPSTIKTLPIDSWPSHALQNESRASSAFPLAESVTSNEISFNTEDEENNSTTVTHSQVASVDNSLPEGSVSVTCMEDPVALSKMRQNLREKHARHVADLRAYYDSEIHNLKQQLERNEASAYGDLKKTNQSLADRCDQLGGALSEANAHMKILENKNNLLEMEVSDLREHLNAASNASKILQERIEEMRASNKEKDNTISRLKSRLKDLEEAFDKAYRLSDDKDARIKQENKMFQALLGEYQSLGKQHERVKDTLSTTENKLFDANTQITDLKRTISKLEAQIKQVEHENMSKLRINTKNQISASLTSTVTVSDVSRRKWLIPGAEYSIFTGQPLDSQDNLVDNQLGESYTLRYHTPPEKDCPLKDSTSLKERETSDTSIVKVYKNHEEGKIFKNWGTQTENEDTSNKTLSRRQTVGFVPETTFSRNRSPEKGSHQRSKKYNSSQRSSSLPPSSRKSSTSTKRDVMLTPVTMAYSPKRSPKENFSQGFSHLRSKDDSSNRFDVLTDDLDTVPVSTIQLNNSRKQVQFLPVDDLEESKHLSSNATDHHVKHSSYASAQSSPNGMKKMSLSSSLEKNKSPYGPCKAKSTAASYDDDFEYLAHVRTLSETEQLFDDLTKEKQQIEAALSRMPTSGGRMTLQTRLSQEALEDRLERINRELGPIRMTLKRFHVLHSSANL